MQLYGYQEEGVGFLVDNPRAYLADGMGLGKTVQAVVAARKVDARRTLVTAPASTLHNWRREWGRAAAPGRELELVSYDRLARYPGDYNRKWDLVILDEAHYAKNPQAKRTQAALAIAAKASRSWLLSGTPMPNDPSELWAPIHALWPALPAELGITTAFAWLNRFCRWKATPFGKVVYGVKDSKLLASMLRTFMLRRTVEQVASFLPPLRVDVALLQRDALVDLALSALGLNQSELLRAIEQQEKSEDTSLPRLRRLLGEAKAPKIAELLDEELETKAYKKIVVFAYHHSVMAVLREKLSKHGIVGFDGSTPTEKRQAAIDAFTNQPKTRVFIAQQNAAGIGINLQAAHEIVLVEPSWSPEDNAQAIKRIHRIGQDNPCRARIFAIADSLDEAVMDVCARKAQMQFNLGL